MSTLLEKRDSPDQTTTDAKIRLLKVLAASLILAVGVAFMAYAMGGKDAAQRDYVCYWAAGQQLLHHENPYDGGAILRIQEAVGYTGGRPFFMRNPPTAFFLVFPLGFIGMRAGAVLWSLMIVAALMMSVRLIWIMHGRTPDRLHLVGYLFAPALACLLHGQTAIFLLLGVLLFLFFRESNQYLAGAALLLPALKPHLFLPYGVTLLAWIVTRKAYQVLAGATFALALSVGLSLLLDRASWSEYAEMARMEKISDEFIPTISLAFRLLIHRDALWLQFVPAAVGSIWAAAYFSRHRDNWDWDHHGSVVLLVSVMVAPYAWFTDEAIVLPAILAGLYFASESGRSLIPYCLIAGAAVVEVFANFHVNSGAYIWTAPAWLLWYLHASSYGQRQKPGIRLGRWLERRLPMHADGVKVDVLPENQQSVLN
jgi:hypothetical protein